MDLIPLLFVVEGNNTFRGGTGKPVTKTHMKSTIFFLK